MAWHVERRAAEQNQAETEVIENTNEVADDTPTSKGDQGGCSSLGSTSVGPVKEEGEPTIPHAPNQVKLSPESAKLLQDYLDTFRAGKVPPAAFPIGSLSRAHAESGVEKHVGTMK